jgi:hypothetical protein
MKGYKCLVLISLALALLIGAAGGPASKRVHGATGNSTAVGAPAPFVEVWKTHGGEEILASSKFLAKAIRITPTSGAGYIEREVVFAVDQDRLRRDAQDPAGLRKTLDLFDLGAGYRGRVIEMSDGVYTTTDAEGGQNRVDTLRFSSEIFGLLPLLREFAGSTLTYSVGRTDKMLDEFHVVTPSGQWTVYSDPRHLISAVARGHLAIKYAGYRQVGGLRLPFIQRVYLGERLVYELYFTAIDPAPEFDRAYFDSSGLN